MRSTSSHLWALLLLPRGVCVWTGGRYRCQISARALRLGCTKGAPDLFVGVGRVQVAAMCGLGNRCKCVYYSCQVIDSAVQNCHHQGKRQ